MNKYYALEQKDNEATLYIFGDITSWEWYENDVSSYTLAKELAEINAEKIHVHINSYGGEVAEGLAIYNLLRQSKAEIITYCDGFACSIASVVFMAGDQRVMSNASLLMIHNAWTFAMGNAGQLRKEADDLDKIMTASINAYLDHIEIERDELIEMLDAETWLTPEEALEMGFATSVSSAVISSKASQNVRKAVYSLMTNGIIGDKIIREAVAASLPPLPDTIPSSDPKPEQNKTFNMIQALTGKKE